jgi:hypothetical protein
LWLSGGKPVGNRAGANPDEGDGMKNNAVDSQQGSAAQKKTR